MTQTRVVTCHLCKLGRLSECRIKIPMGRQERYGAGTLEHLQCDVCGSVVKHAGTSATGRRIEIRARNSTPKKA